MEIHQIGLPETYQPKKSAPIYIGRYKSRYPLPRRDMTDDEKIKFLIPKNHDQLVSFFLQLEDGYEEEMQNLKTKIQNIMHKDFKEFQDRVSRALAVLDLN